MTFGTSVSIPASRRATAGARHRGYRLPLGIVLVRRTGPLGHDSWWLAGTHWYAKIEAQQSPALRIWTFSFTRLRKAGRGSSRSGATE